MSQKFRASVVVMTFFHSIEIIGDKDFLIEIVRLCWKGALSGTPLQTRQRPCSQKHHLPVQSLFEHLASLFAVEVLANRPRLEDVN